jgi:hypothetical protein
VIEAATDGTGIQNEAELMRTLERLMPAASAKKPAAARGR